MANKGVEMSSLTIQSQVNLGQEAVAPTPASVVAVSTLGAPVAAQSTVAPLNLPVDPRHQARIQALTRQVQSGNYAPNPADVAAAWLKTVR